MKASPLQSKIQKAREVLRAAAPKKGWGGTECAPAHPRAAWERGLWRGGDPLLEDQTAGTPPGAVPGPRQGAGRRKPGSLCWGPRIRVGLAGPHGEAELPMAAGPGSSLVSRGLYCQSDWFVATSSRQPRGRLRKTPQQGDEAGGRHSVCVRLALAS